jgi:hypothetical protein
LLRYLLLASLILATKNRCPWKKIISVAPASASHDASHSAIYLAFAFLGIATSCCRGSFVACEVSILLRFSLLSRVFLEDFYGLFGFR